MQELENTLKRPNKHSRTINAIITNAATNNGYVSSANNIT